MKKILLILFTFILVTSCDNEPLGSNNTSHPNSSELTLKEVSALAGDSLGLNPGFILEKFYYYEDGRPEFYEKYLGNSTTDLWARHFINYNESDLIDDLLLAITGEPGRINFDYEDNNISYLEWGIPQPVNDKYEVTYEGNSIILTRLPLFGNDIIRTQYFHFNNETYDLLLSYESTTNTIDISTIIREYEYDDNSNLILLTEKEFDFNTNEYIVTSTKSFTYDDKKNPYKLSYSSSPIITHSLFNLPAPILMNDKVSTNNILTITETTTSSTIVEENTYEYNDLGYPVSNQKSRTETTNSGEQYTNTFSKTYTYW
ncbi:MAG: hypothetical protein Tsb0033_04450 [Winogradskyella sp.]